MIDFSNDYKVITEEDNKRLEEKRKQPVPPTNIKEGSIVKINFNHDRVYNYYLNIHYKVKHIEWSSMFLDYLVLIDVVLNEETINEIQKSYKVGHVVNPIRKEMFLSDTLILVNE